MSPSYFYHTDTPTRTASVEVLTKILKQGAEFNMLADSVLADRYEQLVQLVTMINDDGEVPIAMALANVVTTSQMVKFRNLDCSRRSIQGERYTEIFFYPG